MTLKTQEQLFMKSLMTCLSLEKATTVLSYYITLRDEDRLANHKTDKREDKRDEG